MFLNRIVFFNKIGLLICLWLLAGGICAQELKKEQDGQVRFDDVYRLGLLFPNATGSTIMAEAYSFKTGFLVDARVFFNNKWFGGFQLRRFNAEVIAPELVGNFDETKITDIGILAGYSVFGKESPFSLEMDLGMGYVGYRNGFSDIETRFSDSGLSIITGLSVTQGLNKTLGMFCQLHYQRHFLNIETSSIIKRDLNNVSFILLSFGLTAQFY